MSVCSCPRSLGTQGVAQFCTLPVIWIGCRCPDLDTHTHGIWTPGCPILQRITIQGGARYTKQQGTMSAVGAEHSACVEWHSFPRDVRPGQAMTRLHWSGVEWTGLDWTGVLPLSTLHRSKVCEGCSTAILSSRVHRSATPSTTTLRPCYHVSAIASAPASWFPLRVPRRVQCGLLRRPTWTAELRIEDTSCDGRALRSQRARPESQRRTRNKHVWNKPPFPEHWAARNDARRVHV